MRRVLIISPYFPPVNAADMQRVRMSLPYFQENGWQAEVVMVDEAYTDMAQDQLLLKSLDKDVVIHKVKAIKKSATAKFGLGSVALRSLWYYRMKVNALLKKKHFDLIYFSTTQFPVCILGAYWKKKFGLPYVIDMQDPWHSNYYRDNPHAQRPAKYWFSYRLNRYLEPIAMSRVDGLVSVSENYIAELKRRYPRIRQIPASTITFGAFDRDMEIAEESRSLFKPVIDKNDVNIVYIGRGGADMHRAVGPLFAAVQHGLRSNPGLYGQLKLYFIGTSYAPNGTGIKTIEPLAATYQLGGHVVEITDRIGYYQSLTILQQADGLFIPGSDDPGYTASKIYPYLLTKKPLLGIFHPESSALSILAAFGAPYAFSTYSVKQEDIEEFLSKVIAGGIAVNYDPETMQKYAARHMAKLQCRLFGRVLNSTGL